VKPARRKTQKEILREKKLEEERLKAEQGSKQGMSVIEEAPVE
jgi:hypothetical protein